MECHYTAQLPTCAWLGKDPRWDDSGNLAKAVEVHRYLIVIEKTNGNYSAYSPDLPGCVATGKELDKVKGNMQEAIEMHIQGLREDQLPIPEPSSVGDYVSVA